jgi:signal transduction histidine kinase
VALVAARPAFPLLSSDLLSPDTYASPLLGPLLRSPLDLLLTAAAAFVVALVVWRAAATARPRSPHAARVFGSLLLGVPVVAGAFVVVADAVTNASIDLSAAPLWPRSTAHLAVQAALVLVVAAATLAAAALASLGGPWLGDRGPIVALVASAVAGAVACVWLGGLWDVPAWPAFVAWVGAAALGRGTRRLLDRLAAAEAGRLAAVAIFGVAAITAVLHPTLVHLGQNALRAQIEKSYAPLVLQQPEWRAFVMQAAQSRIDGMKLLEEAPPGIYYPGVEELAFAIWSATDLAGYGFSSAVEVQDPSGAVISRFALNLPFLAGPERRLPASEQWSVSREPLGVASTETMVLHAQRLLSYHGAPHGAVHVYVGEDFSSLPFVRWRDPYSVLFRNAARGGVPERPVNLVVWDAHRDVAFSSLERPPALDPALAASALAASRSSGGVWSGLAVEDAGYHAYVFAADGRVYALAYPQVALDRYAADLVEAVSALALLAAALLFLVFLVRSLMGRTTVSIGSLRGMVARRFALRLFVAFTFVAFVPAAVLQLMVGGFVANRLRREAEDQALDRAAVAKKAVEDYAFFQRAETPAAEPVTDAALVWLASVVKNDLDLFVGGRLQASSKRELYASGLLAPRVSSRVFRAVVLGGQPAVLETVHIGGFSYLVASVPVHVGSRDHAVLSMPLALRQREAQATVDDLDRTIRLASVLFLALAALLAQSMSRRISEPIRDLTRATRRVAEGDLEAHVEARSQDELRTLVESFNQMARDLRRQRRDLERSNRLAAWAEMARQVAHEVKNPLTPIQLSAEHLRRVWSDGTADFGAALETCTDTILKQVRTLRGMVTEFSAFARPPAPALERHDLGAIVEDATRPYRTALPPGVGIAIEREPAPPVRADRRLLERALVNLLENALQAVGEAGRITVRVARRSEPDRVEVVVEDSGPGVPTEMRDRVFEPFFSTKTSGSGLGLALVKKIAEDHDGGVALESAPGQPTRAVLWLPVAE